MSYEQYAGLIRVSGSWPRLLTDWLDLHGIDAPAIRTRVVDLQRLDTVPMLAWAELLQDTFALRPAEVAPATVGRLQAVLKARVKSARACANCHKRSPVT